MSAEVELQMLKGSGFQTVGAEMLKPRETKIVRTRGTDSSVGKRQRRTCASVIEKGTKTSRLRGVENVVCQSKFMRQTFCQQHNANVSSDTQTMAKMSAIFSFSRD